MAIDPRALLLLALALETPTPTLPSNTAAQFANFDPIQADREGEGDFPLVTPVCTLPSYSPYKFFSFSFSFLQPNFFRLLSFSYCIVEFPPPPARSAALARVVVRRVVEAAQLPEITGLLRRERAHEHGALEHLSTPTSQPRLSPVSASHRPQPHRRQYFLQPLGAPATVGRSHQACFALQQNPILAV